MKKNKFFSKGLQIAILAVTVFSMSGLGIFITPNQAQAIQEIKGEECNPGPTWAWSVVKDGTDQGTTKDGGEVANNRSNPLAALGPADGNAIGTFFSLGKEGYITVKFEYPVLDGEDDDISIHETTNGTYPEETALVEVSYDGATWYEIGTASNLNTNANSYFDLSTVNLPIANYVRVTDTTDFSLHNDDADGFDIDAIDAVYGVCDDVEPSFIQGKKFNDFNGNGVRDKETDESENADEFMDGWMMRLYNSKWENIKSMSTGDDTTEAGKVQNGQFRFTNLYPDTYYVCELQKEGWVQTKPGDEDKGIVVNESEMNDEAPLCFKIKITEDGQKKTWKQFGNFELASLKGKKCEDPNGNGDFLPFHGENDCIPLEGWTIYIDMNKNGELDENEPQDVTNANGMYYFDHKLEPNMTYRVREVMQEGWEQTRPKNGNHYVNVQESGKTYWRNFGNYQTPEPETATISGYKWHDINGNREWDEEEPVLNDWEICIQPYIIGESTVSALNPLRATSLGLINTINEGTPPEKECVTTGSGEWEDGYYEFSNLEAGKYTINETMQQGWEQMVPGIYNIINITKPEIYTWNFGNRMLADISIEKTVLVNGEESNTASEGDTLTYNITIKNKGDASDYDLMITDSLPNDTTLVPNWGGDLADPTVDGDTYTWLLPELLGNSSVSVTFDVTINSDLQIGETSIENTALLYRFEGEKTRLNGPSDGLTFFNTLFGIQTAYAQMPPEPALIATSNLVITTVTIEEPAPTPTTTEPEPEPTGIVLGDTTTPILQIAKTASVEFANPGDTVSYTITVENAGEGQALDVSVDDTLPEGLTFVENSTTSNTWVIGAIDENASKTLTYDVKVADNATAGNYTNIAIATSNNADDVQDDATIEVRIPAVLGATVPETGASPRDLIIFLASLLIIFAGTLFLKEGRKAFKFN